MADGHVQGAKKLSFAELSNLFARSLHWADVFPRGKGEHVDLFSVTIVRNQVAQTGKTQFFSHPVLFWFAFEGCFLIWFTPNILFDYNTEKVNVSQSHSWGIWTSKLPPWGFLAQVGGWDGWAEKDQTTRHNTTPDSRLNRIWRRELTAGVAEEHRGLLVAIAVGTRGELVWRGLHLVAHLG